MISERRLAASHTSFWKNLMPMADAFVRHTNRTLTRATPPCVSAAKGLRNSLISEMSFRLYAHFCNDQVKIEVLVNDDALLNEIGENVRRYIARLEGSDSAVSSMTDSEVRDSIALAKNLKLIMAYGNPGKTVQTQPHFPGCGIVDDCEGDILVGSTLYELKNVERDFRLIDIRQLLTYCALNRAADKAEIKTIGLINARSGLTFKKNVNEISLLTAGISADELFSEIIRYITMDAPSR